MMQFGAEFKENLMEMKKLMDGFRFAHETEVAVGIPQEANAGHKGGMTNAELLYIHCMGSPVNHIPARPVMTLGVNDPLYQNTIADQLSQGMKSALSGNLSAANACYTKAGMAGQSAVQAQFGSDKLAPNKPATVIRKGSSAPLINTGALRQAITFVVRKKRG